jgi:LCP family protein required for cell wall assembly
MPRQSKPDKPRWKRIFGGVFYGLICVFCIVGGALAAWITSSDVVRTVLRQSLYHTSPEEAWGGKDSVNLLVLGCDEDWYYKGSQLIHPQARSDMMLVAKLDFKNNRISGVSIPRDTLAHPQGYRRQKINAFHVVGGAKASKAAVESILPVDIDRVVVLDYGAFQEMVNMVGGVRLDVPKAMDYDDNAGHLHIHLKPGVQVLDGSKAEDFVRFRHSDSDYMRQSRQKDFLLAFKNSMIRHPGLLPQVAEKAREVMGNSMSAEEIASLALFVKSVGKDNIKMGMIPTVAMGRSSSLRVDAVKLPRVLREFHMTDDRYSSAVSDNR